MSYTLQTGISTAKLLANFAIKKILNNFRPGDLLEAFVEKVHADFLLILADLTAKSIIRIYGWTQFIKSHYAKSTAIKQIESALLTQLFVAATAFFFEYHH